LTEVKRIIMTVIEKQPELMNTPAPVVTFSGFGDSALNLHIGAWCKTEIYHSVRYEFATAILAAFAEHGISIPFPIRSIAKYQPNA
jgi:small conductance mechanosensitive channel